MPSYIELNKSTSLPAASAASKVVFGINDLGEAVVVDSNGVTMPISQSNFSSASYALYAVTASYSLNGGGATVIPGPSDFVNIYSYGNWIQGLDNFGYSNTLDKFTGLAESTQSGDYLSLEFVGGQVNGAGISTYPIQSLYITSSDVYYRNDGYGTYAANYIDFLNGFLTSHSLHTTFTGSKNYFNNNTPLATYCKTDNFCFMFKESGSILTPNQLLVPQYYTFRSVLNNDIEDAINAIPGSPSTYPFQPWVLW